MCKIVFPCHIISYYIYMYRTANYNTIEVFFSVKHPLEFLYGIRAGSLIFFLFTIGRVCCAAMESHLKEAIDVGLKFSTPVSYSDDTNTSHKLTSVLLNEFNYLPWSRAVTIALGGRSKLSFINGSTVSPEVNDPEYEAWLSKDQLVMS